MAFDGTTIAAITKELSDCFDGCRIYKIAQPETDELLLTIRGNSTQYRLLLSADASLPLVYLTENNKPGPINAPGFCMLLRKHLQNAKILSVTQPSLERIIRIELEHLDELGDLRHKSLIIEIMGKHSNIIFVDEDDVIIDSIKHISHNISSVREVLPGKKWFIPLTENKSNPLTENVESFIHVIRNNPSPVFKALYQSYTGLSPMIAHEICYRADIDGDCSTSVLEISTCNKLWEAFNSIMTSIRTGQYTPCIIYDKGIPLEYCAFHLQMYQDKDCVDCSSISALLENFYREKSIVVRIRQRSIDLRKIVQSALERNVKKLDLQTKQMDDTKKRDEYRIWGELINTYGYSMPSGSKVLKATNYYNGEEVSIPIDTQLSVSENAVKYFDKYNKLKRTYEALTTLIAETSAEVTHLESIMTALDIAVAEEDLVEIKQELTMTGYIRYKNTGKKIKITSKPFHYISSDGYDIYVGKNNLQNDELTFKFANGDDWWFHAKGMPGSHVIVQSKHEELPDRTFEEAAKLASYYSKAKGQSRIEIDYTLRKNVKKPSGAKPGFVVYYTNYSMLSDSDIAGINRVENK